MIKKVNLTPHQSPIDYYNSNHLQDAIELACKAKGVSYLKGHLLHVNDSGQVVDLKRFEDGFVTTDTGSKYFYPEIKYTPFMIYTMFAHKGDYNMAYYEVNWKYFNAANPFIRVGVNYFKIIDTYDRFGIKRSELARWTKEAIKDDYTAGFIKNVKRFDGFVSNPDNISHSRLYKGMYNMYHPFSHQPKQGEWKWTEVLMRHVFGDQYELGMKYMQTLYLHPKQVLPILVLASKDRVTGKSTFLDWMSLLFGQNMVVVNPADISNSFNSSYANANIIGIEETVSDSKDLVEKLKNLSTTKFISVNQKHIDHFKIPFFAKFIITTNDPEKFLRVDSREIRFWVRELSIPKDFNASILEDLKREMGAFLHHLRLMPEIDFSHSRMVFTPQEIKTDLLTRVKAESRSELFKEMKEQFEVFFDNNQGLEFIYVHPQDIKQRWFAFESRHSASGIRRVLKNEFNLKTEHRKYSPWFDKAGSQLGRVFRIKRLWFEMHEND